ncbi:FIST signal transduction protein [Dinghuibacter silviterrae]|uniref:FIST-like protein n=1 Tax=Dinghuibacter silviterrae TaxID=1539049 RepID=A0A4R8DIF8_9BACT|nr:FIST N-terminal domain-containing protein [Dinghuibacter silviterrae]TDW97355.1 hypothetical protein EDB95_5202 [Dinghuibacter silviterrae]
MQSALYRYTHGDFDRYKTSGAFEEQNAALVLCFSSRAVLDDTDLYGLLHRKFPQAAILVCSTAGEICHTEVTDGSASVTAFCFKHTPLVLKSVDIADYPDSFEAGRALMTSFDPKGLRYVLVLSDGGKVNGSSLSEGMNSVAGDVLLTGGLAGDGDRFQSTLIGAGGTPREGLIAAVGFYGDHLQVGHGSQGGWETFGLEKAVTRSEVNVLYEIDGKNALDIYKHYLGPEADGLPGAALLFPLAVILPGATEPVVRTILSIDEPTASMTFAGNIPVGSKVRFMRANFDRLTHAASNAASGAVAGPDFPPQFALLISCVGRKLILRSRIDEEVEAVDRVFDHRTLLAGFYSYGELSPLTSGGACQLHNQTMTITTFYEVE